ncbi:MAG: TPM domain-containing protein [Fibrobacter sp.]|uniref:TPM domain-containing protein n=1 Tax=Fibrobacter sp. TaxID=35828 RepID=UPI0025C36107|nr:TPM domain-containing protein [Fibrobacter sp.]MBR4783661.1 TPM domain-containing protein [Fibrobacter sp.]
MYQHIKILLATALALSSIAFGLPSRPDKSHIYDENRLVSAQQTEFFDALSSDLAKETGISIDAVLLDDIGEREASQYASDIAEKWKADAGVDGEILIFVAQKQRRKFIVSKGTANGILDDVTLKKLDQEILVPHFRQEHYGDGLLVLAAKLTFMISDDKGTPINIDEKDLPQEEPMTIRGWIFIVVVFGLLIALGTRGRRFGFFDNMKKLLSVSEIEKSQWPEIFKNTFGDNLVSAFISGKCLMEGFDALKSPWTINFILKDNSPAEIEKLAPFMKRASRENLEFVNFYSPAEIIHSLDKSPLEYVHIANRNVALCGIKPLTGFSPHPEKLAAQCEREIRKTLDQLRSNLEEASEQKTPVKHGSASFAKILDEVLPLLYGIYYLETENYPENNEVVLERYPARDLAGLIQTLSGTLARIERGILI